MLVRQLTNTRANLEEGQAGEIVQPQERFERSATTAERQRILYGEQVKQLYKNAVVGLLATVINSFVLAVIQRNVTSRSTLIAWVALLTVINLLRYHDIRTFWRKSPEALEANHWCRRFTVGLALSGMAWGSSAIFLFPIESLAHQTFLAFVIGGMVAGAAGAFSSIMKAFLAFSVPALSPIVIRFALLGDEFHLAMGGMVLLFGIMVLFIARRINTAWIASLQLGLENSGLVSYLTAEKDKLDKLNEKLLLEIRDREKIGEELRKSEDHLRSLSAELLNVYEKERKLVAQEIHDSIGASLAATKFRVENALQEMGGGNPQSRVALESVIPIIQGTIEEARRIQLSLRPSMLDDLGILATIGWFCRQFESTYSNIHINSEIHIQEHETPEPLKIVIYRVLQEALNNIAKHSRASQVFLTLSKMNQTINLAIQDNGQGFDLEKASYRKGAAKGLGLDSMKERTELSGGCFSIESSIETGTLIRASWLVE